MAAREAPRRGVRLAGLDAIDLGVGVLAIGRPARAGRVGADLRWRMRAGSNPPLGEQTKAVARHLKDIAKLGFKVQLSAA